MSENKSNLRRLIPGAIISILLVAAIVYFVDFQTMWNSIQNANYTLLAVSAVLSFLWMFVRGKIWHTLLRNKPKYIDTLFATSEGYLLNTFLPFRLGEIGRVFLLSRKSGIQFGEILPTVVIERMVDLAFSAGLLLVSIPFVVGAEGSERISYIVGSIVLFGLVMMYVLARNNKWALGLFRKLSQSFPPLQKIGGSFLEAFFNGLSVITDGWLFLCFLFWMALDWFIALVAYYLITLAFFPQAEFIWGFFILGAAAFGGAVPALPGGIGTFDGAISAALVLFTGDPSTSLAVALTTRLYNYLNSGVMGGIGLVREGETLSGVYQQLMNLRNKDQTENT